MLLIVDNYTGLALWLQFTIRMTFGKFIIDDDLLMTFFHKQWNPGNRSDQINAMNLTKTSY